MIVDKNNSFVFGSGEYPDWFKRIPVEYKYGNDGVTLSGVVIRNPAGDKLHADVGDRIVMVEETYRGIVCLVIPRIRKRR